MISRLLKKSNRPTLMIAITMFFAFLCTATPTLERYYRETVILYFICVVVLYIQQAKVVRKKMVKIRKHSMLIAFTYVLFFGLTMLWNRDADFQHYLGVLLIIFASLMFVGVVDYVKFRNYFIIACEIISCYSLLLTVYLNINPSAAGQFTTIEVEDLSWKSISVFYNVWGWSQWSVVIRNSAFFREPGVWGGIASIATFFKIQEMSKKRWERRDYLCLAILTIGAVSSLSTSSIIAVALNFCLFYYDSGRITVKRLLIWIGAVAVFSVVVALNFERLFDKLVAGSETYISLQQRNEGQLAGLSSWLNNPICGAGFTKYVDSIKGTSANSFIDILGKYGTIVFMITVGGLFVSLSRFSRKKMSVLIVAAEMMVILFTQNLILYPLILIWAFYGYNHSKTKTMLDNNG